MDVKQLKQLLDQLHVPEYEYHLNEKPWREERYVLNQEENGEWSVFIWERGARHENFTFENESAACIHLLNQFIVKGGVKMNPNLFLPLGSIVRLKGGDRKMVIVARALQVQNAGRELYFDYGAVPYPQGVVGDQMAYFQADLIDRLLFMGYSDAEDLEAGRNVRRFLETHPDIVRGSVDNWK